MRELNLKEGYIIYDNINKMYFSILEITHDRIVMSVIVRRGNKYRSWWSPGLKWGNAVLSFDEIKSGFKLDQFFLGGLR